MSAGSMVIEAGVVRPTGVALGLGPTHAREFWLNHDVKRKINIGFNGVAAASNFITMVNGNFSLIQSIQESLENISAFLSKSATAVQGLLNAQIAFDKKNIIAMIGGLLELPIAGFIKGFNLFLARGISAGLNHFDGIISRTQKILNGLPVLDVKGNRQYYDDFKKEGWIEGFKIICRHVPILTKELYTEPFKGYLFPRWFFLCSSFMILGSLTAFLGLKKTGAGIRHVFGGLAGIALATDMKTNTNVKQTSEKATERPKGFSNYAISGFVWVLAAIPDFLKHFDFFSSRVKNSTELALFLDRVAGLFFIFGNQRQGEK